jgi:hypothetical protein
MAPLRTSARTSRAYLNALLVLGILVGIALLLVGVRVRGAAAAEISTELRTGTPVDAVVVSAVHASSGGTYVVAFTDRGHSYRVRLTSYDEAVRLDVGDHVTAYTDGGSPPRVVTADDLTSDRGNSDGGLVLMYGGGLIAFLGAIHVFRRRPTGQTTPAYAQIPDYDPQQPDFEIVPRGYHRGQVINIFRRVHEVMASGSEADRAALIQQLRTSGCRTQAHGYDRSQVDLAFAALIRALKQ